MGVFESNNPTEFNIREFQRTCFMFNQEWQNIIKKSKIDNLDIL